MKASIFHEVVCHGVRTWLV